MNYCENCGDVRTPFQFCSSKCADEHEASINPEYARQLQNEWWEDDEEICSFCGNKICPCCGK